MGIGPLFWLGLLGLIVAVWAFSLWTRSEISVAVKRTKRELKERGMLDDGINPPSGEKIYDSVSLEEAALTKGEPYLLAACEAEQFKVAQETRRPLKLGYFKKERWTGGLPFYLFRCPRCQNWGVGYKSGYGPSLWCGHCQRPIPFAEFPGALATADTGGPSSSAQN